MSNCETFNLPALDVEQHHVRGVLRCLLHTIVFNRALGFVKPKDVDSDLFEITYVQCGDPHVEQLIEEKISAFITWTDRHPGKRGQVVLSFYEKRRKQAWFAKQEERLYWEQWVISINVPQTNYSVEEQNFSGSANVRSQREAKLQGAVEEALCTIVRLVGEKKDHIPPVLSTAAVTFPFDICVAGESAGFGLETFKRMLTHMQTNPPPMLS